MSVGPIPGRRPARSWPALLAALLWLAAVSCGGAERAAPGTTSSSASGATTTTTSAASTTTSTSTLPTAPPPSTTSTAAPKPRPTATTTTRPRATTTTRPPTPLGPGDRRLFVLGDSVLLGARAALPAALGGWQVTIDTVGSRRLPQGITVLQARRSELGRAVVIHLGNNYLPGEGDFGAQIDTAMRVLGDVERVVWVTVAEKWPSRRAINDAIRAAAGRWPAIRVADWASLVAAHPEYASDMLHLTAAGRVAIANLIAATVGPAPA